MRKFIEWLGTWMPTAWTMLLIIIITFSGIGVAYKVVSKSNNPEKRAMYNDVRQYLLGQGKGVNLDTYNQTKKGDPETRFRNSGNW